MSNVYIFTNCGAYGRSGPNQSQISSGYPAGNPLYGKVTSNNGVQSWVVPEDGTYTIEARGAQGGVPITYQTKGGLGAIVSGTFNLKAGTVLKILVGQKGCAYGYDGGGGGGSFVAAVDPTSPYTFLVTGDPIKPLIAAGGGGGGACNNNGMDASITPNGTIGATPGSGGEGGYNGNGGTASSNGYGSAGGGFATAGVYNGHSGNDYPGASFLAGGLGGSSAYDETAISGCGGFGCGGGTHGNGWGGGGGGGWSGGSTSSGSQFGGGGGGSYNSGGFQTFNVSNYGHGLVLITKGVAKNETYNFTNCGATGRYGPTQNQIDTNYIGTNLATRVVSNGGIQIWTVPKTGLYYIETYGARGGNQPDYGLTGSGFGRIMRSLVELKAGDRLKILVGQMGLDASGDFTAGGGGGSFVTMMDNTPLVIAGGGGATSSDSAGLSAYIETVTAQNKKPGYGFDSSVPPGGGGGGLLTDGLASFSDGQGRAFVNGGIGGGAGGGCGVGGFGGGGGAADEVGAGGGGYTGGYPCDGPSEGGASFIASNSVIMDFSGGLSYDTGKVTISMIYTNSVFYFIEQDDKLYMPNEQNYDIINDTFGYIPKAEVFDYINNDLFASTFTSNSASLLFKDFKLYDGTSYKTINPIKYFDLKKAKIFAVIKDDTIKSNALRIDYKVNKDALVNKCQIQLKDNIVITNKIYDRHFAITSTKSIITMIKKYEKYYNKNWGVDSNTNILNTGIPTDSIIDYNIEADVINLTIAFTDNIYNSADKLSQIKLIAKTGNNYRLLKSNELDVKSNDDYIFITFKNAHTELVVNKLHKKQDRTILVNTLSEF